MRSAVLAPPYRMRNDLRSTLTLRAPARLHLGFLDPSGSLGRRFGSLGVVIDGFDTEIELSPTLADRVTADTVAGAALVERASACLEVLRARTGCRQPLHLRLLQAPPAHGGFGSGTQLALAVGAAFAAWHRIEVATPVLAHWLGRGRRSAIGLHGFDHGGLLLDGGPGDDGRPAPLLSRIAMPEAWRIVVVQDERGHGLAGSEEKSAIAALDRMPAEHAAAICHEVLMRVLPGAADGDFESFAAGVSRVQERLGAYFAPAQHGSAYTSAAVGRLIGGVAASGIPAAIGQSSWGPTGFAIVDSPARADELVRSLEAADRVEPGISLRVVAPRNQGAEIVDHRPPRG